jgi:hypothetical protein
MKKVLLTTVLALAANFAYSQRSVDWSIEEILLPTELRSGNQTTPLNFKYKVVCKNNSTDPVFASDTLGIQIICAQGQSAIFAFPNTSNISLRALGKKCDPGDTIHIDGSLNVGLRVPLSINVRMIFAMEVFNRKDLFPRELQSTISNNVKEKSMIWYCEQGWGVNVNDLLTNTVSLFPNPAKDFTNIQASVVSINEPSVVSVFDMSGKLIFKGNANADGFIQLNTADMNSGIYVVNVTTGSTVLTSKLIVE